MKTSRVYLISNSPRAPYIIWSSKCACLIYFQLNFETRWRKRTICFVHCASKQYSMQLFCRFGMAFFSLNLSFVFISFILLIINCNKFSSCEPSFKFSLVFSNIFSDRCVCLDLNSNFSVCTVFFLFFSGITCFVPYVLPESLSV